MTVEQTSKQYFSQLTIIFGALLLGMLMFFGVTVLLNSSKPESSENPFSLILPVVVVAGITVSVLLFRILIRKANQKEHLKDKLSAYASAFILRSALVEMPCLFALVAYLVTADKNMLLYAGLCLVVFASNRPSRSRLISDLQLSADDRALIENPDAIVAEGKSR